MIGLGILTHERPECFERALQSVIDYVIDHIDFLCTYEDGGSPLYGTDIGSSIAPFADHISSSRNIGVGAAKNKLLDMMQARGCDVMFLMEDDIEVISQEAILGYLAAMTSSGYDHLVFHGHAPNNARPRWTKTDVTAWPESFAPFAVYTSIALQVCGTFDETFRNSWEHIELTQRLAAGGFTAPWPDNLDATGSENWLREQPGAAESSIVRDGFYWTLFERGREYWRKEKPETFRMIWP